MALPRDKMRYGCSHRKASQNGKHAGKAYIPQSDGPVETTDHEHNALENYGGEV
jgi:hypothetical protein